MTTHDGELILYTTEDGQSRIQLRAEGQTVWLTQREMAELFAVSSDNIGLHLKNIYAEGELSREAAAEDSSVVQTEGGREVRRPVSLYNLDTLITAESAKLDILRRHKQGPLQHLFPVMDEAAA